MLTYTYYIFNNLVKNQKGQISFWSVFGLLLIVVAYLLYPELFHNFVKYLFHFLQNTINDSFGNGKSGKTSTTHGTK